MTDISERRTKALSLSNIRGSTCQVCGEPCAKSGHQRCRACYLLEFPETPVRTWCREKGISLLDLSERTGVGYATIRRVAKGEGVTYTIAARITQVTAIPIVILVRGVTRAAYQRRGPA